MRGAVVQWPEMGHTSEQVAPDTAERGTSAIFPYPVLNPHVCDSASKSFLFLSLAGLGHVESSIDAILA